MTYLVTGSPEHLRMDSQQRKSGCWGTHLYTLTIAGRNEQIISEIEDHGNKVTKLTNNFQTTTNMLTEQNTLTPALSYT